MIASRGVVLLSGPEDDCPGDDVMKFRLTYEGCDLRPSQQNKPFHLPDKLAIPKHKLRRHFHHQLKHLWNTNKFLKTHRMPATGETQRPISAEATTADPAW